MSNQGEEEFEVECILDKRTKKGVLEYYVKWLGYSMEDSTWERVSNLNCEDLIHKYEEKLLKKADKVRSEKVKQDAEKVIKRPAKLAVDHKMFDAGVEPETFTGIVSVDGQYHVFVRYAGDADQELVPIDLLKVKWPQQVIRFLEKRLVIDMREDSDMDEKEADDQPVSSQSSAPSSIAGSSSSRCDPMDQDN